VDTQTHATIDNLYKVEGKAELVHREIIEMLPAEDEPSSAGGDIIVSLHASARHIRHGNTSPDGIGRTAS
jgi:hypothetical protein